MSSVSVSSSPAGPRAPAVDTPAVPMRTAPEPVEPEVPVATDPLAILKRRAGRAVRGSARGSSRVLSEEQLHAFVMQELEHVIAEERVPLTAAERNRIVSAVSDDVLGYGPIETYLADPTVTEVMVNAEKAIYVERDGRLYETPSRSCPTSTSDGSSTGSSPRSVGASTSRRRWSTPDSPTARG